MSNKTLPPLNWLRAFEAAARHMSFTDAAEELFFTQAAISKQIKNLESRLGQELFVRLPNGLQLTPVGAAYLPAVRQAIDSLELATRETFGTDQRHPLTTLCWCQCVQARSNQFAISINSYSRLCDIGFLRLEKIFQEKTLNLVTVKKSTIYRLVY